MDAAWVTAANEAIESDPSLLSVPTDNEPVAYPPPEWTRMSGCGNPHDHCLVPDLGCSLPKVPAVSLWAGRPSFQGGNLLELAQPHCESFRRMM